mgnify:CR=1 FL=1
MTLPGLIAVLGNHDQAMFLPPHWSATSQLEHSAAWTRRQLRPEHLDFLRDLLYVRHAHGAIFARAAVDFPSSWEYVVEPIEGGDDPIKRFAAQALATLNPLLEVLEAVSSRFGRAPRETRQQSLAVGGPPGGELRTGAGDGTADTRVGLQRTQCREQRPSIGKAPVGGDSPGTS